MLLTASGGGHTGFALAVAAYLPHDVEIVFSVPRGDVFTKSKIAALGRDNTLIVEHTPGRGPLESIYKAVPRLAKALVETIFRLPRVDAALCTGHNNCVPPCLSSWAKRSPLVSLEDVYRVEKRSRAISFLSRFSRIVALHWEIQKPLYPGKGVVVGPVYEPPRYEPRPGEFILVTTGTYGYEELFDVVLDLVRSSEIEDRVVLQTGRVPPEKYRAEGIEAFSFDPDIERYIARAKLVITHQGMTALLAALGYRKPTIIVYNPAWRLTASPAETRQVAELLGLGFLERPVKEQLVQAIRSVREPKAEDFGNGARKLAQILLETATR